MKIALLSQGSRGDIEPFIVLGKALCRRGHKVVVSAPKNFTSNIVEAGLKPAPIDVDVQELLKTDEGKKLLKANPFTILNSLNNFIYPHIEQSLELYYRLSKENDRIVYHTKTLCDCFQHLFPGKMMRAMLVPAVEPTRSFANPALSGISFFKLFPIVSFNLQRMGISFFRKPVNEFARHAGIKVSNGRVCNPFLYGISEVLLPKPDDYPATSHFTGFWRERSNAVLPEFVKDFLDAGPAPIVVTFGSMTDDRQKECIRSIIGISRKLNIRLIVFSSWSNYDISGVSSDVLFVNQLPYDILFPHIRAVIHHGGVGTVAACMESGKPMFVIPVMYPVGDQMFWGERVYKLGIAVRPLPLKKVNSSVLFERISELVLSEKLYARACEIKDRLHSQGDGVENAVRIIENGCG